jgi:hypothetical protein
MKYSGIAVIPTQGLLDKDGKELFRHSGLYSSNELEKAVLFANWDYTAPLKIN